jgi:hypothetical protein
MSGRVWTDDEIGLAISLPPKEAAELLDRSLSAVRNIRHRVERGDSNVGRWRNLEPAFIGLRTLLAKTCPQCGWLMDSKFYRKNRKGWATDCRWCSSSRKSERPRKKDRSQRPRNPNPTPRSGLVWTEQDHIVASDPTLTVMEKAVKLERSYAAVTIVCSTYKYRSLNARLYDKSDGQWQIKFRQQPDESNLW